MRCEDCRDAISARMDGEDSPGLGEPGVVDATVEAHLTTCATCRTFVDRAAHVTRLARIRPADPVPDVLPGLLAALDSSSITERPTATRTRDDGRSSVRERAFDGVRLALGAVGVGQLVLAVNGIVVGTDLGHDVQVAGTSMAHFAHESSAWNLALGVAFLWVAGTTSRRTSGLVPMIGAFVALLVALSVPDMVTGRVHPDRLTGHTLVIAGLVLLMLHRRLSRGGGGASTASGPLDGDTSATAAVIGPHRLDDATDGEGGLKPTARRRAA
jgi:predicted anti-sigma-YlaC factor YlaD